MIDYQLVALQEVLILLPVWFRMFNREHLRHRGAFSAITTDRQTDLNLSVRYTCQHTCQHMVWSTEANETEAGQEVGFALMCCGYNETSQFKGYAFLLRVWGCWQVSSYLVTAIALTATRPAGSRMGSLYFLLLHADPRCTAAGFDPSRV